MHFEYHINHFTHGKWEIATVISQNVDMYKVLSDFRKENPNAQFVSLNVRNPIG